MRAPPNERADPSGVGNGSEKNVHAAKQSTSKNTKPLPDTQRLRRLTAQIAALADWRDDLPKMIAAAEHHLEHGQLIAEEIDILREAVLQWRLEVSGLILEMTREQRRAAS
jgi:hypothetical protein